MVNTRNNETTINDLKKFLNSYFKIKDLVVLKYFIGFEVAQSMAGITICQRKYKLDILEEAGQVGEKSSIVPMIPKLVLIENGSGALKEPSQ